ncbi:hypothetical protein [Stygiolobus sp. CP8521M]|uniref:hypothetical protein n=1 Tax=Stygiolobus sp. CP8521M TaxID=3133136 RepID=UPI00307DE945
MDLTDKVLPYLRNKSDLPKVMDHINSRTTVVNMRLKNVTKIAHYPDGYTEITSKWVALTLKDTDSAQPSMTITVPAREVNILDYSLEVKIDKKKINVTPTINVFSNKKGYVTIFIKSSPFSKKRGDINEVSVKLSLFNPIFTPNNLKEFLREVDGKDFIIDAATVTDVFWVISESYITCYKGFNFRGGFYFEVPLETDLNKLSINQLETYRKGEINNAECYSLELYLPELKIYGYVLLL